MCGDDPEFPGVVDGHHRQGAGGIAVVKMKGRGYVHEVPSFRCKRSKGIRPGAVVPALGFFLAVIGQASAAAWQRRSAASSEVEVTGADNLSRAQASSPFGV